MDIEKTVREFQQGRDRRKRFRSIYYHCYPVVEAFFTKRGVPREDHYDLAQTTLMQVYEGLDTFRADCPFMAWVFVIARNNLSRWRRQNRGDVQVPLEEPAGAESDRGTQELEAPGPSPEEEAERKKIRQLVRQSVRDLSPRQRLCIELHYFQERSYREIASIMGITTGAVGAHINFARNHLNERLKDHVPPLAGGPS